MDRHELRKEYLRALRCGIDGGDVDKELSVLATKLEVFAEEQTDERRKNRYLETAKNIDNQRQFLKDNPDKKQLALNMWRYIQIYGEERGLDKLFEKFPTKDSFVKE